ncbi:MAG: hypothetical protein ACU841_06665 [Gammaproteobacteria bacterium]
MNSMFPWFTGALLSLMAYSVPASDAIKVMTLNQYLGADLTPVLAAPDAGTFNAALVAVLAQTARSDFRSRARAQARVISKRAPDVVALQEVWRLSCADFDSNPTTGCEDPAIADAFLDHLELTLEALNTLGNKRPRYKEAARVKNLDTEKIQVSGFPLPGIPFNVNGVDAVLVAVDRDIILVRKEIDAQAVEFLGCLKPSADGCNYQIVVEAPTLVGPVDVERGFVAVDATVGGKDYRIVNTHLEIRGEEIGDPLFTFYQASQAFELIQTVALTSPPNRSVLLLGDINSSPVQVDPSTLIVTPYHQFQAAGYFDIWDLKRGNPPGYTCCQDGDLSNRKSALSERIDMIFSADEPARIGKVRVKAGRIPKNGPSGPLWFSDHGAVAANIRF